MKTGILTLILASSLIISIVHAQGIQFGSFPKGWSEILATAKAEHKGIFVDCYATWCGPCKAMDADVYPKNEVGKVYNKQFICVRLQMDQTNTDDNTTKALYGFAKWLGNFCNVNAYPTFLFFDDNGNPTHKAVGYQDAKQFVQLAKDAQNPEKQYYAILKNFRPGKLDTAEERGLAINLHYTDKTLAGKIAADYISRIPAKDFTTRANASFISGFQQEPEIINTVSRYFAGLNKKQLANAGNLSLIRSLSANKSINVIAQRYINKLSEKELYDPLNLEFIKGVTDSSADRGFKFFHENSVKIDTIMHYDTWAKQLLEKVIYKEECQAVIDQAKKTNAEPDWNRLTATISSKYGQLYVARNMLKAKVDYYQFTKQWGLYVKYFVEQRKGWDVSKISSVLTLNNSADVVFQYSNNKAELETALTWANRAVEVQGDKPSGNVVDTKANLLYKLGNKADALALEQKAAALSPRDKEIQNNYQKMQQGLPTWNVR